MGIFLTNYTKLCKEKIVGHRALGLHDVFLFELPVRAENFHNYFVMACENQKRFFAFCCVLKLLQI